MKPKFVIVSDGSLNGRHKVYRFKLHLKRSFKCGADTDNEAYCGYYPIGGNNGQLKMNARDVDCSKCLKIFNYLSGKSRHKMVMPWNKTPKRVSK